MGSNLLDFYAKCGQLEEACIVFNRLYVHNVDTLMIGYTNHGKNIEALEIY